MSNTHETVTEGNWKFVPEVVKVSWKQRYESLDNAAIANLLSMIKDKRMTNPAKIKACLELGVERGLITVS